MNYKISVFGLGFVGLTTALGFAEKGHMVFGYDVDQERINIINSGRIPFAEPGLDTALKRHLDKNFAIIANPLEAVRSSDIVFLCVGTPCGENGEADLKYIYSALDIISPILGDGKYRVVVVKSTVPPSTTKDRIFPFLEEKGLKPGKLFGIANNPEFLREGKCWEDFMNADRIVCGVNDEKSSEMLRSLYSSFDAPFFAVSPNTGEFIKYLSNTLLATMISYANEMSIIADVIEEIDVQKAFNILHKDRRWGGCGMASYVYPGCGYGGYCLPKDTQAMAAIAKAKGFEAGILKNVIATNQRMPSFMVQKIKRISDPSTRIGILGLSFKPDSDDVRDSASAKIIKLLQDEGYLNLLAYDPLSNDLFNREYGFTGVIYYNSLTEICEKSDVLVLITAWREFTDLHRRYPDKKIIDCRYFL
jgi:nucleotide sugar dehydrogenase